MRKNMVYILSKLRLYLVLFFSAISCISMGQDISGNYSIGTSGTADYSTITDAVNELKTGSVVGDIVYTIESGTYNETIDLSGIFNGDYSITFKGMNKETTIIHPLDSIASSQSGILVDGMQNLILKDFTLNMDDISDTETFYGTLETKGILVNNSSNITFENIDFYLSIYDGTDGSELIGSCIALNDVQSIEVDACSFSGGIKHIWMDDFVNVAITNNVFERGYDFISAEMSEGATCNNLLIQNNDFDTPTQYAINIEGVWAIDSIENVEILSNKINYSSSTTYSMAIQVNYTSGVTITDNTITNAHDGIDLRYADRVTLERNEVYVDEFSLHLQEIESPLVRNNIFQSSFNTAAELWYCSDLRFLNNTVIGISTNGRDFIYGRGFDLNSNTGKAIIVNNIFSNANPDGYNVLIVGNNWDDLVMDHNLFSTIPTNPFSIAGGNYLKGVVLTPDVYDFSAWQTITGADANSQVFHPEFVSDTDLRIQNAKDYRFGLVLEDVTEDLDGDVRPSTGIDVGADQYYAISDMCGEYTIGTSGSTDFVTITEAINTLKSATISCDVTLMLEAGTYNETIDFSGIANDDYVVTFKGMDKATTIIHPLDSMESSKSGILMDGMQNLVFRDLTLEMDDISATKVDYLSNETKGISIDESQNIQLVNITFNSSGLNMTDGKEFIACALALWDVQNVVIDSCFFSGASIPIWFDNFDTVEITNNEFDRSYYHIRNVQSTGSVGNDLLIEGNVFQDSYFYSLLIIGDDVSKSTYTSGVLVQNNLMNYETESNYQKGIVIEHASDLLISQNTIVNAKDGVDASLSYGVIIEKNEISVRNIALHMAINDSSVIKNNMLYSDGALSGYSLYFEYNTDMSFVNNTINSLTTNTQIHFTYLYGEGNISNNIFSSSAEAITPIRILGCELTSLKMDHNLYDVDPEKTFVLQANNSIAGETLTNGEYDLSAWQVLTSLDGNSRVLQPEFVSETDLHITNATDYRFGTYLADVPTDIDGELRLESVGIDVGADQFCISKEVTLNEVACTSYTFDGIELTESGQYVAQLVAANGCDSLVTLNLTIDPLDPSCIITATEPINQNNIQYGPNPTLGDFTVQLNQVEDQVTVQIYNLLGELHSSHEYRNTSSIQGQIEGAAGIYLIKISYGTGANSSLRIVKQ